MWPFPLKFTDLWILPTTPMNSWVRTLYKTQLYNTDYTRKASALCQTHPLAYPTFYISFSLSYILHILGPLNPCPPPEYFGSLMSCVLLDTARVYKTRTWVSVLWLEKVPSSPVIEKTGRQMRQQRAYLLQDACYQVRSPTMIPEHPSKSWWVIGSGC